MPQSPGWARYTLEFLCGAALELLCMDPPQQQDEPPEQTWQCSVPGDTREDRHLPAPRASKFLSQQQENKHNNDLPQQQLEAAVPACLQYQ